MAAGNWTTQDYFDPFPGMAVADRRRQIAENTRATGVAEARGAEEQRMRQADVLARMGVDPVMGPEGGVDWNATAQAARMKQELGRQAQALAAFHAWQGGPTVLTPEEQALTQTKEYQTAYRMVAAEVAKSEAEQLALTERAGLRASSNAMVTRKLPDGTTVRVPMSPEEAMQMGGGGAEAPQGDDRWQQAIDAIMRFESSGTPIDVEIDKEGFPRVEKDSNFWPDAKPAMKGSYQKQIDMINKRRQAAGAAPAAAASGAEAAKSKMIVIPR